MSVYLKAFSFRLDLAAQDLAPAYFAMVMATGVLSLTSNTFGFHLLARYLFILNILFYSVLWILTLWRFLYFSKRLWNDVLDYQRGPGFFSMVAASSVLGSQFISLDGFHSVAQGLWLFGVVLWLLLNYGIFTLYTIRVDKPKLEHGISGIWLLAVVAVQSLAVLALQLDSPWSALHRLEYNFIALSLWLWGGMLYIWIMVLIFYRYNFFRFDAEDLVPPYWINMGAMAISTLAGSLLIEHGGSAPYLHSLLPFLRGFTIFYWAAGSWWIPLLIALEVWRHGHQGLPFRYDPQYWGMVFPLGMYSLATHDMAKSMTLPFLQPISSFFFILAWCAWIFVVISMLRRYSVSIASNW